jgi:hypothetical protein
VCWRFPAGSALPAECQSLRHCSAATKGQRNARPSSLMPSSAPQAVAHHQYPAPSQRVDSQLPSSRPGHSRNCQAAGLLTVQTAGSSRRYRKDTIATESGLPDRHRQPVRIVADTAGQFRHAWRSTPPRRKRPGPVSIAQKPLLIGRPALLKVIASVGPACLPVSLQMYSACVSPEGPASTPGAAAGGGDYRILKAPGGHASSCTAMMGLAA